jgi:hypothetical protein
LLPGLLICCCSISATTVRAGTMMDLYAGMTAFKVVESFSIRDFTITRDAATIELKSGEISIIESVKNRYHSALFTGTGTFRFRPPNAIERDQLHKFTGNRILEEPFQSMLLRFSDATGLDLKAQNPDPMTGRTPAGRTCAPCRDIRDKILKRYLRNVDSRILRDFHADKSGYFAAYVLSKSKGEFLLEIDPEQEEQISITQHASMDIVDVWSSFSSTETKIRDEISIPYFEVELDIEKNGNVKAASTVEVLPLIDGIRALPFNFSSLLKIEQILDEGGNEISYIYETAEDRIGEPPRKQDKLDVFFQSPLQRGKPVRLKFLYSSEHLVEREGNRNEYLVRDTTGWYPTYGFLNRSASKATYCHPAGLELFAVGKKSNQRTEGKKECSTWEQTHPVAFISFSLGEYKHKQIAVEGLPSADIFSGKGHSGFRFGGSGLDNVAADIVNSLNFFQTLYGPYPFDAILATEIPAAHGQGFPGFLHLSRQTFEDAQLTGIDEGFRAHEVSHQWWGHVVGWKTYHDQWISEGFAEFSGAIYADAIQPKSGLLMKIVESWKDDVLNRGSVRRQRYGAPKLPGRFTMGTEAGPIWLGLRLISSKSPADYHLLVYQKGAYVLHMLRMMMKDFQTNSDDRFFTMMKDFVRTHSWKNASTREFQEIAEKHFGSSLQWFFDQWVYGTHVPKYEFKWRIEQSPDNKFILVCDIRQKNVPDGFKMPVPVHLDFGKDRFAVQRILVDVPVKTVRIPLPEKPRNVQFNYQRAVLSRD